jgi:hypothetical protein
MHLRYRLGKTLRIEAQVIPAEAVEAAARLFVAQVASMMKRYEERKSKIKMKAAA